MSALSSILDTVSSTMHIPIDPAKGEMFVRAAERNISMGLRVRDMMVTRDATIHNGRGPLPSDWQEAEYVRYNDGKVLRYAEPEEFYEEPGGRRFTVIGNELRIARNIPEGVAIEMAYYADVPKTDQDETWLTTKFRWMLVCSIAVIVSADTIEDERAMVWAAALNQQITQANDAWKVSKASGSRLSVKRKGFG